MPLFMAIKPILSEMAMICGMVLLCVVCPPSPLTRQRCSVAAWHLRDRQHPGWSGRAKLGNLSLGGALQCHPVDAQPSHTQHDEQSGEHHTLTCPHIVTRTIALQAVLLVSVAASCQAGLLGAGHGEGSCAAAPFRTPVTALKWPAGCPGGAECCTEFGYCRPQAEWLAGAFRDCNGVSNGLPLSPETIAAENEAAAYGDPAAAALLVVPAAAAAPAVAVPAAVHAAPAVAAVHAAPAAAYAAAPAVAAYNYAPAPLAYNGYGVY